jgi:hypothetical protein
LDFRSSFLLAFLSDIWVWMVGGLERFFIIFFAMAVKLLGVVAISYRMILLCVRRKYIISIVNRYNSSSS